jgi:hypothetical protein
MLPTSGGKAMVNLVAEAGLLTALSGAGLMGFKLHFDAHKRARPRPIRIAVTGAALARRHADLARAQEALRLHGSL